MLRIHMIGDHFASILRRGTRNCKANLFSLTLTDDLDSDDYLLFVNIGTFEPPLNAPLRIVSVILVDAVKAMHETVSLCVDCSHCARLLTSFTFS